MKKVTIVKSKKETIRKLNEITYFKSDFSFLKQVRGWRPGKMHLIMGTAGSGKSSLMRGLLFDYMNKNPTKKVLMILSEETVDDFETAMSYTDFDFSKGSNLYVASELEMNFNSPNGFCKYIEECVREANIELIIYDNITTSKLYNDKTPKDQFEFVSQVKKITSIEKIAMLLVCHAGAGVFDNTNRLINENDIRGSKSIVNLMEFLFVMQRFSIEDVPTQTLRILKHRGQDPENNIYMLNWNKDKKLYETDRPANFREFKEIFQIRDKL